MDELRDCRVRPLVSRRILSIHSRGHEGNLASESNPPGLEEHEHFVVGPGGNQYDIPYPVKPELRVPPIVLSGKKVRSSHFNQRLVTLRDQFVKKPFQ